METPHLMDPSIWESDAVELRLNPKRSVAVEGLKAFVEDELGIRAAIVLASSGSGGVAKFVVLSKAALLASARAVNALGGLTRDDIWLGNLSTFHVGGIGIHARAYANGAKVVPMPWDGWTRDGSGFLSAIDEARATLASLTPTHLWDLVRVGARAPETLRGLFLGGGRIDPALVAEAKDLGWPVWPTYGMTETASQVATSVEGNPEWLPLLPIWEARSDEEGRLWLKGAALCEGTVTKDEGPWVYHPSRDLDGWMATGDACELRGRELRFLSRLDGAVKVSGELVSLPILNDRLAELGIVGMVVAVPEPRRGNELVLVCEKGHTDAKRCFNEDLPPIEQVVRMIEVASLPRTEIGKLDRAAIEAMVCSRPH
jgi:O-succinylbenzoic acid--CoA ligase